MMRGTALRAGFSLAIPCQRIQRHLNFAADATILPHLWALSWGPSSQGSIALRAARPHLNSFCSCHRNVCDAGRLSAPKIASSATPRSSRGLGSHRQVPPARSTATQLASVTAASRRQQPGSTAAASAARAAAPAPACDPCEQPATSPASTYSHGPAATGDAAPPAVASAAAEEEAEAPPWEAPPVVALDVEFVVLRPRGGGASFQVPTEVAVVGTGGVVYHSYCHPGAQALIFMRGWRCRLPSCLRRSGQLSEPCASARLCCRMGNTCLRVQNSSFHPASLSSPRRNLCISSCCA